MSTSDHELLSILIEVVCAVVVGVFQERYSIAWGVVMLSGRVVRFSVTAVWVLWSARKEQRLVLD